MMKPKVVYLPHGNLMYSQLRPDKRSWAIQKSYNIIFDLVLKKDACRIGFEALLHSFELIQSLNQYIEAELMEYSYFGEN